MKQKIYPKTVAMVITRQCTAQCKMCCFECSPQIKEKMPIEMCEKVIAEASEIEEIKTIGFSGGEPFLEYSNLLKLIALGKASGKRVICTSNGFWGNTFDSAEKIVFDIKNAGLDKLSLSVDWFHNEYVSVDKIKNILKVCNKQELAVDVGSVITRSKSKLNNIFDILAEDMVNVPHYTAACLPVGKASKYIEKSDLIYDEFILSRSNRCIEIDYFAIFPNGNVFPCCSQAGATEALRIGNIQNFTLKELYKKYNSNINIRILKSKGLNWYLSLAAKLGYERLTTKEYVNKCDLCWNIFSDKEFMCAITPYLEKEKKRIYEKYLATERK